MRKVLCSLSLLLFATVAAAQSLPEQFKEAKDTYARGDHVRSLAAFERLDAESQKPGFEADRAKLVPAITFYRGANLSALGRKAEAKEAFVAYLELVPNASISAPTFPKATVDLFEQARKEAARHDATIGRQYLSFAMPAGWTLPADASWTDSPVRYLLTDDEKKAYAVLATPAEREAFVAKFWKDLDPTPESERNEFRDEFERRVAFADAHLGTEKVRGRDTERGAIFVIVGPPTYAARAPLARNDDTMEELRKKGNSQLFPSHRLPRVAAVTPTGFAVHEGRVASGREAQQQTLAFGEREAWIYRPNDVPSRVERAELRFDFISKEGYGIGVLQKDPEPLQAFALAAAAARRDKSLD